MRTASCAVAAALLLAACATAPVAPPPAAGGSPFPFSLASLGEAAPQGWAPLKVTRLKRPTEYRVVEEEGRRCVKSIAKAAASGLQFPTSMDLREFPLLAWHWKVPALIEAANNTVPHAEDSPARVIVAFEGGRDALPPEEQMNYDLALAMTGQRMPFAVLMYIWENRLPEGTVIHHHLTSRVKMIVAGSGGANLGVWHEERHDVLADYRRAFGEEPPRVKAVGIMTDSDNTGAEASAFFGDIRFLRR